MTTTTDLRTIAVAALHNKTSAGTRIYSPRDWPTANDSYPTLFITAPEEEGESAGRHAPFFTVTSTLRITARVKQGAGENDSGAALALSQLETMREEIKSAVINYPPLMQQLQQFPFFRSKMQVSNEAAHHLGELVIDIGMEFIQSADEFYPDITKPLEEVTVNIEQPEGTAHPGLDIHLPQQEK